MEVVTASALGMCFGVRDAIALAEALAQQGPVAILGELVHNPQVVAELEERGARTVGAPEELVRRLAAGGAATGADGADGAKGGGPLAGAGAAASADAPGAEVDPAARLLITAHGTSNAVRRQLAASGRRAFDATCPLVERAHRAALVLAAEGRHVVVLGRADHVEVRGLIGDLPEATVVSDERDLDALAGRTRLGVIAQTTQPVDHVLRLLARLRARLPHADVKFVDTVCAPTKDRQLAVAELVSQVDAVIVVGGPESNNTHKLVARVQALGRPAWRVAAAEELRPEWLRGCRRVGLTAGTSTPDGVIEAVRRRLEALEPAAGLRSA
ncbi:MAG: 4-hydroxy-3-methylbut-2-enyl diphosphate reductase [Planctomycetes bacterium]|nr:4-hydroxy-3-methylbut-2-enyl diphosphate reductase [Planctomycetota bacterium]